jgi:hypothetical protein
MPAETVNTLTEELQNIKLREQEVFEKLLKAQKDKVRDLYVKLGQPPQRIFEDIITRKLISNCPVTIEDLRRNRIVYDTERNCLSL